MFERALRHPLTMGLILLGGCIIAIASALIGTKAFEQGWSNAAWLAWPSGVIPFFIPGLILWLLLLIPPGPLENRWTRRVAMTLVTSVALGAIVQLLDDHVLNHAGTDNPLGFSLPYQDFATTVPLIMLAVALVGTVLVTIYRAVRYLNGRLKA